jgi:hypothetical protein
VRAFVQGLAETGQIEGRDVTIEYRWAHGNSDKLPALASELVRRQPAVISSSVSRSDHRTGFVTPLVTLSANPLREIGHFTACFGI